MAAPREPDLQRLLAEESFVRALARELLVDDPDEVVQQTYLNAVRHGGENVTTPRSWLARVARNVASNLRRADRNRRRHERTPDADTPTPLVPSTAELAEREERRRELVTAVDALPDPLRTVVLLRWFDGQPPRRIAAALGVSAATVSTRLQRAHQLLRERLDAAHHDDRRAWLLPLVPLAVRPELPPVAPVAPLVAAATGVIAMTSKTQLSLAATALVAAVAAFFYWSDRDPTGAPPPDATQRADVDAARGRVAKAAQETTAASPSVARERAPEATLPDAPEVGAGTGDVLVTLRYAEDDAPAAGVTLILTAPGDDTRFDARRLRTDAGGRARFTALSPGRRYVRSVQTAGTRVEVVAGETVEVEMQVEAGLDLRGVVVDAQQRPVAGAQVEMTMMATSVTFPEVAATTADDGTFAVRAAPRYVLVGARAEGHTASPVKFLHGKQGNDAEVRLVLGDDGHAVEGRVVDTDGAPIADAAVIVGDGELSGIAGRDHIPPFPALAFTDREGRFRAIGVPDGEQRLQVRATGFAPWTGAVAVAAEEPAAPHVVLQRGGEVRGVVHDQEGTPVANVDVSIGKWDELAHYEATSRADGTFALMGLPLGDVELRARHEELGKASATVTTTAEGPVDCALQLSRGRELRVRVVDADGQPVASGYVEAFAEGNRPDRWFSFQRIDERGACTLSNCPDTGTIAINVRGEGFAEQRWPGIDPTSGDVQIQVERLPPRSARIAGTVVDPDGHPLGNASVSVNREPRGSASGLYVTDDEGGFDLGPFPPGEWKLSIRHPQFPAYDDGPHALAANETWQLGTITLLRGGTATLRTSGDMVERADFLARGVDRFSYSTFGEEAGAPRSRPLAPGDYHLLVSGDGVAMQAVPFVIRADEETVVDVAAQAGVVQTVVCEVPGDVDRTTVTFEVRRDGVYVGRRAADVGADRRATTELCLQPGSYAVTVGLGERTASATCTVGATAGPPVRVRLP